MTKKSIPLAALFFAGLAAAQPKCATDAGDILKNLLPAAEQVAGAALRIEMPDTVLLGKIGNSSSWFGSHSYYGEAGMAEVDVATGLKTGRYPVLVYASFCGKPAALQEAILAHELGHVIDFTLHGEHRNIGDWEMRRTEIDATRYGLAIMRAAGLDVQAMNKLFARSSEAYKKAAGLMDQAPPPRK